MTIQVHLTLAELEAAGVCSEDREFFKSSGLNGVRVDWSVEAQVKYLRLNAKFVTWAMHENFLPMLRMVDADLQDANLRDANLAGADLRGADLTKADLASACLEGACLGGAYLAGTYLMGANLRGHRPHERRPHERQPR